MCHVTRHRSLSRWAGALLVSVLSLSATACGGNSLPSTGGSTRAIPLALIPFSGSAPLYVASDKNLCASNGIKLKLIETDSQSAEDTIMAKGDAEIAVYANTSLVFAAAAGVPIRAFLELDMSNGADGFVADSSVTSIRQMAEKHVLFAADETDVEFFLFMYAAQKIGLHPQDFNHSALKGGDSLAAFLTGRLGAVGESEPNLSKALGRPGAHLLFSSKDYPGLISDQFVARQSTLSHHLDDLTAFARCWYRTLAWISSNPDSAIKIMAKHIGLSPQEMKAAIPTTAWPNQAQGRDFFLNGQYVDSLQFADDFYKGLGQLSGTPVPGRQLVSDAVIRTLG
jgi:NitT/TauT family transport system substrate-binding protein